jgi:hypothetical protein
MPLPYRHGPPNPLFAAATETDLNLLSGDENEEKIVVIRSLLVPVAALRMVAHVAAARSSPSPFLLRQNELATKSGTSRKEVPRIKG